MLEFCFERSCMNRFLLFFWGVVAVCASNAVQASACSENSLSIKIVDQIRGPEFSSISEISDPVYRNFASIITSHVESLMQRGGGCVGEGVNYSSLIFVRGPLIQNRPAAPLPSSSGESIFNGCRLSSPWVDFEFDNSTTSKIRGVIRWSQRQLLVDQAMMAGDIQVADAKAAALSDGEFESYAQAYVDYELLHKPGASPLGSSIPPDILWLFRNSWQSTRGPFSLGAMNAMDNLMEREAESYSDLVISLIDHCVSSGWGELRYETVLDLKGVVPLGKYKAGSLL